MTVMPKFSVVVNCYNGERYLRQALESVYAQTFGDWEIVFWDNASTDGSAAIARSFDQRLKYFASDTNVPLGAARNRAVQKAQGEWIGFLDCDDYWLPHKLERQLAAVEGTDHVLCYAGIRDIDLEGNVLRDDLPQHSSGHLLDGLLRQFDINMVTPIVRRSALERFGLNFEPGITASEEYNLFVRLAAKGTFAVIPEVLGVGRVSSSSLTFRQISKWAEERFYTLDQLATENPGIVERHREAFQEARARGTYYRARYLVSEGNLREARAEMANIRSHALRYRALWLSLWVPSLWQLIHQPEVKRKLLDVWGRLST